jgi:hypothetical protein
MKVYLTEMYIIEGRKYNMRFKYLVPFRNNYHINPSDDKQLYCWFKFFKYPTDQLICNSKIETYEWNSRVVLGGKLEDRRFWLYRVYAQ